MNVAKYSGYVKPSLVLILNGLYCDTIFVTEYYGVAWWTSSKKSDDFNNSLKCGRRIIDNTHKHTRVEFVSRLHVLNVHIEYVHYTDTHSKNFARWIANLLFMLRGFVADQDVFHLLVCQNCSI